MCTAPLNLARLRCLPLYLHKCRLRPTPNSRDLQNRLKLESFVNWTSIYRTSTFIPLLPLHISCFEDASPKTRWLEVHHTSLSAESGLGWDCLESMARFKAKASSAQPFWALQNSLLDRNPILQLVASRSVPVGPCLVDIVLQDRAAYP